MTQTAIKDYVKVPKKEYSLLKEVYRTVKRQAFLIRLDDAEKNLVAGKTKTVSVDDLIASVQLASMKPRSITFDSVFEKHWHKYLKGLTDKQKDHLKERLTIFKEDVFDKRLKTHRLKGNLKEYYAFSISYSDRIIFRIIEDEGVYFMEIGGHDVCY